MIGNKTRLMINKATQQHMTPQDAAQTLYEYAGFRTTKERLEPFAAGKDLRTLLTEGLLVNDPSRKRDSQDRNVRNWLRGDKDVEIHRSTAFEIAFLLELNAQDMNALLASLTEEGLRWRDPEQIILIYARIKGMSWPEAMALKQRLGSFEALSDSMPISQDNMTASVRNDVLELRSEEELLQYLRSSAGQLGHMHNTAFVLFTKFMGLLEAPESPWGEKTNFDRKMSVREILQLYLYRDLIPVTNRKNKDAQNSAQLTPQQKAMLTQIRAGWPDESELSRMKSRESDVTRKVLILLFLATDGAGLQFSKKAALANRPVNHAAICRDSIARMNRMLGGCGYCLLDARSPFDWIVIYWLSVDAIEDTDLRMAQSLTALFSGSEKQEQPAE